MKKESGAVNLLLALAAFAGLGLEILVGLMIEPIIYGISINNWSTAQNISHWVITCCLWGISSVCILKFAKNKYSFDLWRPGKEVKVWKWIVILVIIACNVYISYRDFHGFKVIKEFYANGWLKFIFQYIYYIFETVLVTLIIIFGQKACDLWFHQPKIPFGGIVLALTWGLAHCFTKDFVMGVICFISAICYGCIYLLVDRDIRKAYPLILMVLIL